MPTIGNHRRYLLLKAYSIQRAGTTGLPNALWGKQSSIAGTALAATFPCRALLVASHYETEQDLDGCDVDELILNVAGITRIQAAAVVAAASGF